MFFLNVALPKKIKEIVSSMSSMSLCHLPKVLPPAVHINLLNRFQPSNRSGLIFKSQVYGYEQKKTALKKSIIKTFL